MNKTMTMIMVELDILTEVQVTWGLRFFVINQITCTYLQRCFYWPCFFGAHHELYEDASKEGFKFYLFVEKELGAKLSTRKSTVKLEPNSAFSISKRNWGNNQFMWLLQFLLNRALLRVLSFLPLLEIWVVILKPHLLQFLWKKLLLRIFLSLIYKLNQTPLVSLYMPFCLKRVISYTLFFQSILSVMLKS